MKKFKNILTVIMIVCLSLVLSACSKANEPAVEKPAKPSVTTTSNNAEQKIVIRKGDKQLIVKLGQGSAAKDLYNRLPLKLKLEDFNNTEKIAYLNSALKLDGEPKGYTPHKGDLAYYAPWKNLSVFYKEFRYSENLIYLGKIETTSVNLEEFEGNDIVIERAK